MSVVFSDREWQGAVRDFAKGTKYEGAESINKSMASVIYRAPYSLIRKTYRQTKAGVTRDIKRRGDMIYVLATKWLERKGAVINEQTVATAAQRIVTARRKSVRYIVAGWAVGAIAFGASRIRRPGGKSEAAKGWGTKATPRNLEAEAGNAVGAEIQDARIYNDSYQTIKQALEAETENLKERLQSRMNRLAGRHSGR